MTSPRGSVGAAAPDTRDGPVPRRNGPVGAQRPYCRWMLSSSAYPVPPAKFGDPFASRITL